jgi:transcriptional regulator with XRE-family HTH domain
LDRTSGEPLDIVADVPPIPELSSDTIGDALLAKRRERRLDQGRAAAEIGVSPSTYRSYEKNTQRPSVNVFPLLSQFLGLEIEEFLPLYASTVIFALRPALEKELAHQAGNAGADGTTYVHQEAHDDARSPDDDTHEGATTGLEDEKEESFTYVRDDATIQSPPSDTLAKFDEESFFDEDEVDEVDEVDEDDEDDEDDDEEEFETSDLDTGGEIAAPSSSQFTSFSADFEKSSKKKKKKKKK